MIEHKRSLRLGVPASAQSNTLTRILCQGEDITVKGEAQNFVHQPFCILFYYSVHIFLFVEHWDHPAPWPTSFCKCPTLRLTMPTDTTFPPSRGIHSTSRHPGCAAPCWGTHALWSKPTRGSRPIGVPPSCLNGMHAFCCEIRGKFPSIFAPLRILERQSELRWKGRAKVPACVQEDVGGHNDNVNTRM
jgi:hypothetical protein